MTELHPPDTHHLSAAEGWSELGNYAEALVELAQLSPAAQDCLEVLGLRWSIAAQQQQWEQCLQIASAIIERVPDHSFGWIHRSYALHELKRTREARDFLLAVAAQFPDDETISYNLACYECQLGDLTTAWQWFEETLTRRNPARLREHALEDPDLQPIWSRIAKLPPSGSS